jgi:hypothetical protein
MGRRLYLFVNRQGLTTAARGCPTPAAAQLLQKL